jgi:hypothetical protein
MRRRDSSAIRCRLCHRVDGQLNALSLSLQRYLEVEKETADSDLLAAVSQACSNAVQRWVVALGTSSILYRFRFGSIIAMEAKQSASDNDLLVKKLVDIFQSVVLLY